MYDHAEVIFRLEKLWGTIYEGLHKISIAYQDWGLNYREIILRVSKE